MLTSYFGPIARSTLAIVTSSSRRRNKSSSVIRTTPSSRLRPYRVFVIEASFEEPVVCIRGPSLRVDPSCDIVLPLLTSRPTTGSVANHLPVSSSSITSAFAVIRFPSSLFVFLLPRRLNRTQSRHAGRIVRSHQRWYSTSVRGSPKRRPPRECQPSRELAAVVSEHVAADESIAGPRFFNPFSRVGGPLVGTKASRFSLSPCFSLYLLLCSRESAIEERARRETDHSAWENATRRSHGRPPAPTLVPLIH